MKAFSIKLYKRMQVQGVGVACAWCALWAFIILSPRLVFDRIAWPGDLYIHYIWSSQFIEALCDGVRYPRWTSMSFGGLGQPTFMYYAPLYYYLTAFCWIFVRDVLTAVKLVDYISIWGIGFATWWIIRHLGCKFAWGLLAATFIQCSPFIQMSLAQINGLPALLALSFASLALYRTAQLLTFGLRVDLLLSLFVALMTLTHLLTAYMFLICSGVMVAGWTIVRFPDIRQGTLRLLAWSVTCFWGLAMAAVYLLPAVTTLDYINQGNWTEAIDWRLNLSFPLVTGSSWWIFQWGLASLLCVGFMAIIITYRRSSTNSTGFVGQLSFISLTGLTALFLSSEFSFILWDAVEPLQKLQYGYRFFAMATISLSIVIPVTLGVNLYSRWRLCLLSGFVGLWFLCSLGILGKSTLAEPIDLHSYLKSQTEAQCHQKEYLPAHAGTQWADYLLAGGLANEIGPQQITCMNQELHTHYKKWTLVNVQTGRIRLPVFAYPSWRLYMDGNEVDWIKDAKTGLISAEIGIGEHQIELKWELINPQKWGIMLSSLAWGVWIAVGMRRAITAAQAA